MLKLAAAILFLTGTLTACVGVVGPGPYRGGYYGGGYYGGGYYHHHDWR